MFSNLTRRALIGLLAVVALLAMSAGSAMAGPPYDPPAGLNQPVEYDYRPLEPWEHNVVIVHVVDGTSPADRVDLSQAVGSANDYINGRSQTAWLVDAIVTIHDDGTGGYSFPFGFVDKGREEANWLPSFPRPNQSGSVATGLDIASQLCDIGWAYVCDVILVTYQAPSDADDRRDAMAEAMKLNASYWKQLHTIAVTTDGSDSDHRDFSSLLGALGNHAWTEPAGVAGMVGYILDSSFWTPIYEPFEAPCEIYDPDGNCYYEEDVADCEVYDPDGYCYGEDTAVEADEDMYDDPFYALSDHLDSIVCDYPGLDNLVSEIAEFANWIAQAAKDFLAENYPEADIAGIVDSLDLDEFNEEQAEFLASFCQFMAGDPPVDDLDSWG